MAELDRFEQGLREHLGRPRPLPPGSSDRVVAAMRARLEEAPRQRSPLPLLAGVASGVVLAGVLGAALWSRSAAPSGADRPAGSPTAGTVPGVALPEAGRPGFTVEDVAFGDDVHGWEVGTECAAQGDCVLAVRATSDGGRSWTGPATVAPRPAAPGGSARIAFSGGRTGFVAARGLYASVDGGRTWSDTGLPADVVAVAPVGASVWALQGCPGSASCGVRLLTSADGGRSWAPPAALPGIDGPAAEMVRVSATDAFVAGSAGASPGGSRLIATHDGGRSWQPLPDPCASGLLGAGPAIAALEPTELWAACEAPQAQAGRAVYRSRDGGRHWDLRAHTTAAASDGLGAAGTLRGIALAPRGPVYLALEGGPLLRSSDGGSWSASLGAVPGGGVRRVEFVDTTYGWVVTATGRVLATADGGRTWTAPPP
jgi:photosystem II stability/assembly factor-like uncharacterized protein